MTSVAISQLICTMGLVILILVLPIAYANVQNNIRTEVIEMELKEIADYVSSTFSNTYFLVNSTDAPIITLTKSLVYLPSTVQDSVFIIRIDGDPSNATGISVRLKDHSSIVAIAWLPAGLHGGGIEIESGGGTVVAGCQRDSTGVELLLSREVHS